MWREDNIAVSSMDEIILLTRVIQSFTILSRH